MLLATFASLAYCRYYMLFILFFCHFNWQWHQQEEEKAADAWEIKMAFVLVSHEFGLLFEALAEGLKSRSAELYSACFLAATWLVYMLNVIPETGGIRGSAQVCLLKHFISIFKSAKDIEDRTLSLLALKSFIHDPGRF